MECCNDKLKKNQCQCLCSYSLTPKTLVLVQSWIGFGEWSSQGFLQQCGKCHQATESCQEQYRKLHLCCHLCLFFFFFFCFVWSSRSLVRVYTGAMSTTSCLELLCMSWEVAFLSLSNTACY